MGEDNLYKELFYPGAKVKLRFVEVKDIIKYYETRVEDLENEYLILQAPIYDSTPVTIKEGQELTLQCENERSKQAYLTSVFVIENRLGKIPLLVCCKPRVIDKISLRRYSRFIVDIACAYYTDNTKVNGRVTEISLGGCCVEIDRDPRICEGAELQLVINISDDSQLVFTGEVIRTFDATRDEDFGFALEIRNITRDMHKVLENHIFQCQLMCK